LLLKADTLRNLKVIYSADLQVLAAQICCSTESKERMYRECDHCRDKVIATSAGDPGVQTYWDKWVTCRHEGEKKYPSDEVELVKFSVTEKCTETGTVNQLIEEFSSELQKACRHFFNVYHQYKTLRKLRQNLANDEIVVHMDFSENWSCKYQSEIQCIHFGTN